MNKLTFTQGLIAALLIFTIFNPTTGGDILAFLAIVIIVLYKLFGDYALLALLLARPTMDYWRDYVIFSYNAIHVNMNAAVSVLLLLWSIVFFYKHLSEFKKVPLLAIWIAFMLWCSVSLFWSYDKMATITETLKAANLFALFGMAYILRQKHSEFFDKIFFWLFISAGSVPFIAAIYQFVTNTGMNIDGTPNRIYGTFAHPNILATFSLILFMFLFHNHYDYLQHATKLIKFKPNLFKESKSEFYILAMIFLATIIALTYTRIAWIGLAIFLLAIGLRYARKQTIIFTTSLLMIYGLFFPINYWMKSNLNINLQQNHLIARLTSRNMEADSISWRADLFNKVIPLWAKHPLVGYGYGSFSKVWDDSKGVENIWDNTSEAHNDYLKVGFESGLIGLSLYLGIFINLLYREIKFGQKNHWINFVFIMSIFVYITLSASDNMLHHTPVIWWWWATWGYWSAKV